MFELPDVGHGVEAVHFGHFNVDDDRIEGFFVHGLHRFAAIAREPGLVALHAKREAKNVAGIGKIVNE